MYIDLKPLIEELRPRKIKKGKVLGIIKHGEHTDSTNCIKGIKTEAMKLEVRTITKDLSNIENLYVKMKEIQTFSNGIVPVRPFPRSMEKYLQSSIQEWQDIDNFTGKSIFQNCTSEGVLEILKFLSIGTDKHVLVVGRGIGKVIAKELLRNDFTIAMAHSKTKNLELLTKNADVIISATGVKDLIKKDMVKVNSTVIDVGLGDVERGVEEKADVTPVKSGVGAVTTQILFKHLLEL
ncbi:hypothetical protein [Clostridium tetani]|uniref:methenyltetrahydrofolate cyclohydrolase n=1 Tax=Clostridium tetani TaxID=1513 RepID=A0ABC8EH78_CLOTA|nr:hypothetical protein [Clostridium tetani]BDR82522.1 bifunctional protein FolD [Clostridium tetani]